MKETKKYRNKRISFPKDLEENVLQVCHNQECTFSEWVVLAVQQAIQDLRVAENKRE